MLLLLWTTDPRLSPVRMVEALDTTGFLMELHYGLGGSPPPPHSLSRSLLCRYPLMGPWVQVEVSFALLKLWIPQAHPAHLDVVKVL